MPVTAASNATGTTPTEKTVSILDKKYQRHLRSPVFERNDNGSHHEQPHQSTLFQAPITLTSSNMSQCSAETLRNSLSNSETPNLLDNSDSIGRGVWALTPYTQSPVAMARTLPYNPYTWTPLDLQSYLDEFDDQMSVPSAQEETSYDLEEGGLSNDEARQLSPNESIRTSDSEDGHECAGERSNLSQTRKAMVSQLMDEFCSSFFSQVRHRPRQHGPGPADSGFSGVEHASSNTIESNKDRSRAARGKRVRDGDENPEDEDESKRKRRRMKDSVLSDSPLADMRCFACPFNKFEVSTYSNRNENPRLARKYRSCGPPGWRTIGKMKEHLYRNHETPIHCSRCWTLMKTEAELREHARAESQCDILPQSLRWIPREVYQKLKDRKKSFAGQTDEDTWQYIFGLIFPDCAIVPSPYYEEEMMPDGIAPGGSPTIQAIAAYEEYARAHLPRLVEEALETSIAEQIQRIDASSRRALAGIVQDCQTRLAQSFLQHRSSNRDYAGVLIGRLPSFHIEPLDLAADNPPLDPGYEAATEQGLPGPQTDPGHWNANNPFEPDSRELFGQDFPYSAINDGISIPPEGLTMPNDVDTAALFGNNDDDLMGNQFLDSDNFAAATLL